MELLYFSAPWCVPCIEYKPLVLAVLTEYPDVEVRQINIDDDLKTAYNNQITSIPTLVIKDQPKLVGKASEADLRRWLNLATGRV